MPAPTETEPFRVPNPATTAHHARSIAVLAGAVAGAAVMGFGMLADRLITLIFAPSSAIEFPGGIPTWLWTVGDALPGARSATGILVVTTVALVVFGACAGLAATRRSSAGLAVLLALGATAVVGVLATGSSPVELIAPLVATIVGSAILAALLRYTCAGRYADSPHTAATEDQEGAGLDSLAITRRRALVTVAQLAVGAGFTGLLGRSSAHGRTPAGTPVRPIGSQPMLNRSPVLDVSKFGAVGDGSTDNGDAIRRGLQAVNDAGGTLYFPAGTYYYRSARALRPAPGVTIAGDPGRSTIDFDSPGGTDFAEFCSLAADDVTIDGLIIRRASDFPAVLLVLGVLSGFTLSRSTLVGNHDKFSDTDCHGIKIGTDSRGLTSGIHLIDSTISTTRYGLFQTNDSTAVTTDIRVEYCTFAQNRNTDLEFNSPVGTTRQLVVERCKFSDNDSLGFGVGLAHVEGATIRDNTFDNYALEAVHIEDYSDEIEVRDNYFTACGLRDYSHVQIIGGSTRVRVLGNTFRAGMNANRIFLVNALAGGNGPTVGGRALRAPSSIAVQNNAFECAESVVPVYFEGVRDGSIISNKIDGVGALNSDNSFFLLDSPDTVVRQNEINGQVF